MLKRYRENVALWWNGFEVLGELRYKEDWSAAWFRPMYLLNHGTHVILWGGAVVSWSRFSYENRKRYGMARLVNSILDMVDRGHGEDADGPLWGSEPIPSKEARVVRSIWAAVTLAVAAGIFYLTR